MQADLHVSPEILAICRSAAWDLYKARNLGQAEIVARGLVAVDSCDWYHHALLAATLQKQRRFPEALAQVDQGLTTVPGQVDLLRLRAEIYSSSERLADAERKLALRLSPSVDSADDDGTTRPPTPAQKRRHYLDMIRVVTTVLEAQEEATSALFRNMRI